jgi:hypothetical protein
VDPTRAEKEAGLFFAVTNGPAFKHTAVAIALLRPVGGIAPGGVDARFELYDQYKAERDAARTKKDAAMDCAPAEDAEPPTRDPRLLVRSPIAFKWEAPKHQANVRDERPPRAGGRAATRYQEARWGGRERGAAAQKRDR